MLLTIKDLVKIKKLFCPYNFKKSSAQKWPLKARIIYKMAFHQFSFHDYSYKFLCRCSCVDWTFRGGFGFNVYDNCS